MSQPELCLVPIIKTLTPITTAVLYHKEARAYLRISSAGFNELVRHGIIKQYTHTNGKRPFFLKHELDAYLLSLPRYKMPPRESSQTPKNRE